MSTHGYKASKKLECSNAGVRIRQVHLTGQSAIIAKWNSNASDRTGNLKYIRELNLTYIRDRRKWSHVLFVPRTGC